MTLSRFFDQPKEEDQQGEQGEGQPFNQQRPQSQKPETGGILSKYFEETGRDEGQVLPESPEVVKEVRQQQPNVLDEAVDKTTRLGTQFALGGLERLTAGYDIPAMLASKLATKNASQEFRQNIFSEIEDLLDKKQTQGWDIQDRQRYEQYRNLIENPDKMKEFLPEEDIPIDVGGLIEKGAEKLGVDLSPQSVDELALRWAGFVKNPAKAQELMTNPLNLNKFKSAAKELFPRGKELARGAGAAILMQWAAEAELGPIGTMAMAITGDIVGGLATKNPKKALETIKNPKKFLAKAAAAIPPKNKGEIRNAIVNDFRDAGILADAGTLTASKGIQMLQSTLAQSGLTGDALENFRKELTENFVKQYEGIANELGSTLFESKFEAGQSLKDGLKEAQKLDLSETRDIYAGAREAAEGGAVNTDPLESFLDALERKLTPGKFKSSQRKMVLDTINKVREDLKGGQADVEALINNKIDIRDVVDFEAQGGSKKLLEGVIKQLEGRILSYGEQNPEFRKLWENANKRFSRHADTYRSKTISNALKTENPSVIFSKMNTPGGIQSIRKALSKTPEGRVLYNNLARYKIEEMIGENMVNSTTNQLNFGTFSKLLEKGENRAIANELLGGENLKRLERLQKAASRLAETEQKFLNTSRSGVHATDIAFASKLLRDFTNVLTGNPWQLVRSGGIFLGGRQAAKLMADPEFLRLLEDAVTASKKTGSSRGLVNMGLRLARRGRQLLESEKAQAAYMISPLEGSQEE